jgi:hypothetical protein
VNGNSVGTLPVQCAVSCWGVRLKSTSTALLCAMRILSPPAWVYTSIVVLLCVPHQLLHHLHIVARCGQQQAVGVPEGMPADALRAFNGTLRRSPRTDDFRVARHHSRTQEFKIPPQCLVSDSAILRQRISYRAGIELNRTLEPPMSKSNLNYSARNACMGLILVARLAGNHAAAIVISATATMEMARDRAGLARIGHGLPAKIVKERIREELPLAEGH